MCNIFGKKNEQHRKKSKAKSQTRMPCWTLFYASKKDQQEEEDKGTEKTENKRKNIKTTNSTDTGCNADQVDQNGTPSLFADLPSVSVKSIGANRELSLSKPINSTAFEWNKLGTKARSSKQTKKPEKVVVNTKLTVKKVKNKLPLKCQKNEKG